MSKKKEAAQPSFEEQLARLQLITEELERGELNLERSLALYKEGIGLASGCRKTLEQARNTVRIYTEEGLKDFSGVPEADL